MKKRLFPFALILALMALFCAAACAAEEQDGPDTGFRVVAVEDAYKNDVTLTALTEKDAEVELDTDGVRYPGALKMKIAYGKAQLNSEYLLCVLTDDGSANVVPTADNMAYIDQVTAESVNVEFTAFPKSQGSANSVKYAVYLSSDTDASNPDAGIAAFTKVATFEYYFAGLDVLLGDVNSDGEITVDDAYDALLISVGLMEPTDAQIAAGDVTKTGEVTVDDAYYILLYSVGLISTFDNLA